MTDITPSGDASQFDGSRQLVPLSPADAASLSILPGYAPVPAAEARPASARKRPPCPGRLTLDADALRALRNARLLSQQDLADECWRRNIRVSIATIKRAESGHAVRFRIVRELARCFDVPVARLMAASLQEDSVVDEQDGLLAAVRDTLMHIAGVSGTAAKRLRPGQSLNADLALDDADFKVLAGCQRRLGDRLRQDHGTTWIDADELYDLAVGDVFALTVRRALGRELNASVVAVLFARAQAGLRGTPD